MNFIITGVNHRTLPISLRERLALSPELCASVLGSVAELQGVEECFVLSTCHRTEVYAAVASAAVDEKLQEVLCAVANVSPGDLGNCWYSYVNHDAFRHLFRVTAGLDSMALGETQIFSQMKDAYHLAFSRQRTGPIINQLVHRAFYVAKRIRTETGIGMGSVSMSTIAVEFLEASLCTREPRTLLVIGAGKIGVAAAKSFRERGLGRLSIVNRTYDRAAELAEELGAEALPWEMIGHLLATSDAVVVSCGSREPVITTSMVANRERPLFIVDLSVPRTVDPAVGKQENVILSNIDDLKVIADRNRSLREDAAHLAEGIIAEEAARAEETLLESTVVPTIAELMQKCEEIRLRELDRAFERMGDISLDQRRLIDRCTASIVNKILHDPISVLKENDRNEDAETRLLRFFREAFRLD